MLVLYFVGHQLISPPNIIDHNRLKALKMFNRWPTLLMTLALLIAMAAFFKRFDFLLINEVKALILIIFGFASSFIVLSLIWLLQRKPIQESWRRQNQLHSDTPNMHPRASFGSIGSMEARSGGLATVSGSIDKPPNYDEALIASKPVSTISEKGQSRGSSEHSPIVRTASNNFRCIDHSREQVDQSRPVHLVLSKDCLICSTVRISRQNSIVPEQKDHQHYLTGHSMAQLALSIARGFTTSENTSIVQNDNYNQPNGCIINVSSSSYHGEGRRKPSFCKLDADQLILLSSSPPKYSELSFDIITHQNPFSGNTSKEPRAGFDG